VDTFLTYIIQSGWVKNIQTSTLASDIAQFFPSLNHQLIPLILNKAKSNPKVSKFFSDYLIGRKTQYIWNNFSSLFFEVNIGIEQSFALSSTLLALYFLPLLHIFQKCAKNLKIPVSFLSFIDNGLSRKIF